MTDTIRVLHVAGPEVTSLVTERLERANPRLHVEPVTSASDALERCVGGEVDCVVSDDELPGTDGIELLEAVRERDPDLPFILLADGESEAAASEAVAAGVTDYRPGGAGTAQCELLATRIVDAVGEYRSSEHATGRDPNPDRCDGRWQTVFEHSPDPITVHDVEGTVLEANRRAVALLGYDREELIGMNVADFLAGQTAVEAREDWAALGAGDRVRTEREYRAKDGTTAPVEARVSGVESDGEARFVVCSRDVTRRREGERKLRLFRRAVEASGHSIYVTDVSGTIQYVNPAFEETTGFTAEEAIGQNPRILKSGEHDETFYEELWDTILSGDVWRSEIVNTTKQGHRYVVDQTIAPVTGDGDEIEGFVAVNADITEYKARERRLRRFRSAVEHAGHSVLITDTDGTIEYVNDAFEETTGYSAAEAIGRTPALLNSGEHDAAFFRSLWETILSGEVWQGEVTNVRKDGTRYVVDQTIAPLSDGEEITGFVGINRDVTDLKEYERELERQNERLMEYGHTVAHDLRNPLNLLYAEVEMLRESVGTDEFDAATVRETCQRLTEIAGRMERLIDDLLTMAEQGQLVLETQAVSLEAVAREAWTQLETDDAGLSVDDTTIDADPDRLRELLSNLFRNAVEHAGTDVRVRAGPLDFSEGFFVEDDGPGIPPDEREMAFERGFTTAEEGTGFGLAIVAQIAEAHGWTVSVTDGESGGACFEFRVDRES